MVKYLFDIHDFAHQLSGIESSHGGIGFFTGLHRHESESTGLASVGVVHDRSFFYLGGSKFRTVHWQMGEITYTADFSERSFQVTGINFMAEARDVQIVSRVGTIIAPTEYRMSPWEA